MSQIVSSRPRAGFTLLLQVSRAPRRKYQSCSPRPAIPISGAQADALGRLREEARAEIERLIALLDEIDGVADEREADRDFEPALDRSHNGADGAEQDLGLLDQRDDQRCWSDGSADGGEEDGDFEKRLVAAAARKTVHVLVSRRGA